MSLRTKNASELGLRSTEGFKQLRSIAAAEERGRIFFHGANVEGGASFPSKVIEDTIDKRLSRRQQNADRGGCLVC